MLAVILAAVGIFLVLRYAQNADQRALEGMETDLVYVALEPIAAGTLASELGTRVEAREIPRRFQVAGALDNLAELDGRLALNDIAVGEQLQEDSWLTPDELRTRGTFEVPEEAQDLHQVTVPLGTARALGGNIAPGDTVGVFMSFDATFERGLYVDSDGQVRWLEDGASAESAEEGGGESSGSLSISLTKLAIEKVLVVGVRGGYVPPSTPTTSVDGDESEAEEDSGPSEQVLVTLALTGDDAERLVYAMEFGQVWLSYEPDTAEPDDDDVKVVQLPEEAGDVLQ
ncbi:Flp pilus assembly protein CpaB [Ornithinimicrobium cerasi]|uniref:Flp pilus assembly protein CpaB n=1 Tax=Ornithinimicrobium cerasi TaxID=2248773 RepID=UPI000BE3A4BA|nr:RcpC/CpaB family pilus assembly protein [Ornithinimicrobium cerasi]